MSFVSATIPLEKIVQLSTFFILLTIIAVCFSTIYLRYKQPNLPRKFRCPFVPWVPMVAILLSVQILLTYPSVTIVYAFICLCIATIYYFVYGRYQSKLEI
jgi:APA family basic amino acid/polyamine antiporter